MSPPTTTPAPPEGIAEEQGGTVDVGLRWWEVLTYCTNCQTGHRGRETKLGLHILWPKGCKSRHNKDGCGESHSHKHPGGVGDNPLHFQQKLFESSLQFLPVHFCPSYTPLGHLLLPLLLHLLTVWQQARVAEERHSNYERHNSTEDEAQPPGPHPSRVTGLQVGVPPWIYIDGEEGTAQSVAQGWAYY